MKNTRLQELIKIYADHKWLDARTAEEIFKRILKILLTGRGEDAPRTDGHLITEKTQETKSSNGGKTNEN